MKEFSKLPSYMQQEEIRPYYDILIKKRGQLIVKRTFDVVASLLLLILLSPVLIYLAVRIKKDSKGPVFFRQTRITTNGRKFRIFKFRTMVVDAPKLGTQVTVDQDSRITKVGAVLRSKRLDELPQLLNVLLGDMSFVGTRPEVEQYVREYTPEMLATLLLPAGVTSQASIHYKEEARLLSEAEDADRVYIQTILPDKMQYNLQSIKNFSLWSDLITLFQTVFAVL